MTKFWEAMAGKFADRWAALAGSAFVFWAGAVLVVVYARRRNGGLGAQMDVVLRQPVATQVTVCVAALVVASGSALFVRRVAPLVLTIVQGPWRGWGLSKLSSVFADKAAAKVKRWDAEWLAIAGKLPNATPEEREHYTRLDARLLRYPTADFLPTPVGNAVRASDCRIEEKYGLGVAVVWPRLWLLLPQQVRDELSVGRAAVDAVCCTTVWGAAFALFGFWAWWAVPAGAAVVAASVCWWLPPRVSNFSDLTESAIDLHRLSLYEQLRLSLPTSTAEERDDGAALTEYLYRGTSPDRELKPKAT
ncbi:hypothetical protein [Lentzea sp. NPDC092896]|uniref:hypothetical protein n=1 Tax=Lentzea sp. NPDC092896 TaxID=3364127 RepID=UPI0037FA321D